MTRVKVLFHDHCFDGAASAALFGRFAAERLAPGGELIYVGKGHARGAVFSDADFDADVHACVDFRYAADDRLGWWFDHHASAFQPAADRAHFEARDPSRFFYDPAARSCTKLVADSLARVHGWDASRFAELVRWGELIDGAMFESAAQASSLDEPAMQLAAFAEHNQDEALKRRLIEGMTAGTLAALAAERWVQRVVEPVRERDARATAILSGRLHAEHGVATLDLGDEVLDGYNKFAPYLLAPEACYVVAVSVSHSKTKVSVGQNPWKKPARPVHIAQICERYGGGGHPFVGAVTLPKGALVEARRIAAEIAEELRGAATS